MSRAARGALLAFGVLLTALAAALLAPRLAWAQSRVELSASVDADTVEVGGTVRYQLQTTVVGSVTAPSNAKPGPLPPTFSVVGTSSSPMQMGLSVNGAPTHVHVLSTAWTLRATKVGSFTLGPATVQIGGATRSARPVKVTVVPRGQLPQRPQRGGGPTPFDPFGGLPFDPFGGGSSPFDPFKDLFGQDDDDPLDRLPMDKTYALDEPRGQKVFLHATVDKSQAVVGEQVTLSVYLYSLPEVRLGPSYDHVASAPDFTRRPILPPNKEVGLGRAPVGGRAWDVELVARDALFPMKAGRLTIGPMKRQWIGARDGIRESESLTVDVTEPPLAGRPLGYALGDVGDFSLQTTVSPRALPRGGSVGVTLELRGTGNLPPKLPLPVVPGVEWLDAQVNENLGVQQGDRIGGTRTFTYVVRVDKSGAVDLGEVSVPFYDPDKRAYRVARASLGILDVAEGPGRDAGADDKEAALSDLPKPRTRLEGTLEASYLTDRAVFWGAIFGAPLACVLAVGASEALRRARARRGEAAPRPEDVERTRRAEAEAALAGDDGAAAVGAVARAIEAAVLARAGINVRGAAGNAALRRELEERGVASDVASEIASALRACEDARFSPSGVSVRDARDLWARARAAVDALGGDRSKGERR